MSLDIKHEFSVNYNFVLRSPHNKLICVLTNLHE